MTTPILPLASDLKTTKYTPATLLADQEAENFILNHIGPEVIVRLMNTYRAGATFVNVTSGATAFGTSYDTLTQFKSILEEYGYYVDGPVYPNGSSISISWAASNPFN